MRGAAYITLKDVPVFEQRTQYLVNVVMDDDVYR